MRFEKDFNIFFYLQTKKKQSAFYTNIQLISPFHVSVKMAEYEILAIVDLITDIIFMYI